MKKIVTTGNAPAVRGAYSQAVISRGYVFLSGMLGLDPQTGQLSEGTALQTERALENIAKVLEAAGSSLAHVVKTTVFVKEMSEFVEMNEVYSRYFQTNPPARSTVEVARLPLDAKVEIECVAELRDASD